MARQPTWAKIIKGAIRNSLDGVHTALPGTVVSYVPATQQAVIQPAHPDIPPLEDVPIAWPRGAGGFLHLGLVPGDSVLLVFCEIDTSPWRLTGTAKAPAVLRRHGLFAHAIPGGAPDTRPLTTAAALTGPALGLDLGARVVFPLTGGVEVQANALAPATQPVALSIPNELNWAALVTWAGLVNGALNGLGAPVAPLAALAPTTSAVLKSSG